MAHRVLGVIDYIGTLFYVLEYAHKNGCVKGEMHLTCMDFFIIYMVTLKFNWVINNRVGTSD